MSIFNLFLYIDSDVVLPRDLTLKPIDQKTIVTKQNEDKVYIKNTSKKIYIKED